MSTLTPERKASIIRFAVWMMMTRSYQMANAAAQDKNNTHFEKDACKKFMQDAKDCEELLKELPK